MRKFIQFLHLASRFLAICAVVAGLAGGLLMATMGTAFICFDTCPTPEFFFAYRGPAAVQLMTPCVVIELLALAVFLAYCLATRQVWRGVMSILVFLIGGLVGVAALDALLLHGQATLPVDDGGLLLENPVETWAQMFGMSLLLVAVAWSGVLARMQWAAE